MDDSKIIELYFERSESAIVETDKKYGRLCRYITMNILNSTDDSNEVVNDTYFGVWNTIPPQKPNKFSAFIGRISRNLALKRYEFLSASRRNPEAVISLSELGEVVSGRISVEDEMENRRIEQAINDFLRQQNRDKQTVFIRRYWYFESIDRISRYCGFSQSKVTSMLYNTRQKLKKYLESEGIQL